MKTIRVLPNQVPIVWESVKFAIAHIEGTTDENTPAFFNEVLHDLLSNKRQCFVGLNEDRRLLGIAVTRISVDSYTKKSSMSLEYIYSFDGGVSDEFWLEGVYYIIDFARNVGIKRIIGKTANEKLLRLAVESGFRKTVTTVIAEI